MLVLRAARPHHAGEAPPVVYNAVRRVSSCFLSRRKTTSLLSGRFSVASSSTESCGFCLALDKNEQADNSYRHDGHSLSASLLQYMIFWPKIQKDTRGCLPVLLLLERLCYSQNSLRRTPCLHSEESCLFTSSSRTSFSLSFLLRARAGRQSCLGIRGLH